MNSLLLLLLMLIVSSIAWILQAPAPTIVRSSAYRRCRPFHTSTVCRLNRILFEVSEITNHTTVAIAAAVKDTDACTRIVEIPKTDYRTIHVAKILALQNGATLRSGIVSCDQYPQGLWTDSATIEWLPEGKVKKKAPLGNGQPPGSLRVILSHLTTPPPTQLPTTAVSLILALPRPLQLGRLLPVIASMGCDTLYLISAAKVPRDYWGSHLLRTTTTHDDDDDDDDDTHRCTPAPITALLSEGLAQSGDTRLPRVVLHKGSLRTFLERHFPAPEQQQQPSTTTTRLVAHPSRRRNNNNTTSDPVQESPQRIRDVAPPGIPIVIAVGPEGGWEEPNELERFVSSHFTPVTLGDRTLRTDTAVVSLLALAQDAYAAAAREK